MDDVEPYEPKRPEESYDWDYEEERRGPHILWGRVIALIVLVILAFLIGRATAGGGDDDSARVQELNQQVNDLEADNQQLEDELAAAQAPEASPTASATQTPAEGDGEAEGETYTVQAGDTLRGIAESEYGDASLDDCIASANGITDPESLRTGDDLTIPPEENC